MEVEIPNAVKLFFPKTSFEFVYFEAIANSVDANATAITITNRFQSLKDSSSIEVEVTDNGDGFTDENFLKFSKLFEAKTANHKGLGRLVYLNYFESVDITSLFNGKKRVFVFDNHFSGKNNLIDNERDVKETTLIFKKYIKERLKSYNQISPSTLKESIVRHFFPILYEKKIKGEQLEIIIKQQVGNSESETMTNLEEKVNVSILDELNEVILPTQLDLFNNLKIRYSVKQKDGPCPIITEVCSDGRTIPLTLLSRSQLPEGYELIFIVFSDFFIGKSDPTRQRLTIGDQEMKSLKVLLLQELSNILMKEIPEIKARNEKTTAVFTERYPHLNDYFEKDFVGLIEKDVVLERAQKMFFSDQREILDAVDLDDNKYQKSIEISSRLLMEYILYRTLIIKKLKKMNHNNSEADIHKTIIPMRRILKGDDLEKQFFFNNVWLFDDKFMNFNSIHSDMEMSRLTEQLKIDSDEIKSRKRPDLTIVFSSDVETSEKVDVIIVELKKMGLTLAKREEVISQLRQRARKLLSHYPNKIQRIWFYGIVDFNQEFINFLLEDEYIELYSSGNLYYKEYPMRPDLNNQSYKVPAEFFILDYEAFINDAEARNSTFLKVLKSGFNL